MKIQTSFLALAAAVLSTSLWAGPGHHGDDAHEHAAAHASPAGTPGSEQHVSRIIKVDALDSMSFKHEPITVKAGETIQFDITNHGVLVHEFAIGVTEEHKEHQIMMQQMPNMQHDDPNVVTLQAGETKSLLWTFAKAADIEVACNIPGHYEGGMHSPVQVN